MQRPDVVKRVCIQVNRETAYGRDASSSVFFNLFLTRPDHDDFIEAIGALLHCAKNLK